MNARSRVFPPTRIVCLTEETVETLYLLGEQERIVGISLSKPGAAPSLGRPLLIAEATKGITRPPALSTPPAT